LVARVIYNIKTAILSGCGFFCRVIISVIGGIGVIGVAFTYNTYNTYSKKSFILQKKRPRPEGRSRPAIKKPYSTKRVFTFLYLSLLCARPIGPFWRSVGAIASEAVRYT
jgi:hypothetical protein